MRKKLWVFAGIALLCITGYALYLFNKPHKGIANIAPSESIAAVDLYKIYTADEKAGDTKFLDKIIEVNGVINDVQKSDTAVNIFFKADIMNGVNCSLALKDNDKNITVKAGDNIKLKGKCTGFLMDVELVDCVIEK